MKKQRLVFSFATLALLCVSCASVANFDYRHAAGSMQRFREPISHHTVCVETFEDCRLATVTAGEETSARVQERGSFATGWLPLVPFAWVSKPRPEIPGDHHFVSLKEFDCRFADDLTRAAMASINYSHLFSTPCVPAGQGNAETDWIFRGKLYDSTYEGARITYGGTYLAAPALWLVGFPTGVSRNHLSVGFELVNRRTGRIAWQFHYADSANTVHWLYWNVGKDTSRYGQLMRIAMNAALYNLSQNFPALEE